MHVDRSCTHLFRVCACWHKRRSERKQKNRGILEKRCMHSGFSALRLLPEGLDREQTSSGHRFTVATATDHSPEPATANIFAKLPSPNFGRANILTASHPAALHPGYFTRTRSPEEEWEQLLFTVSSWTSLDIWCVTPPSDKHSEQRLKSLRLGQASLFPHKDALVVFEQLLKAFKCVEPGEVAGPFGYTNKQTRLAIWRQGLVLVVVLAAKLLLVK